MRRLGFLGLILAGSTAFAHNHDAEGISVGGFVDGQFNWTKDSNNEFVINDAATYVGKRVGSFNAFIDIGFSSYATGLSIDQAYLGNKYDGGLSWTLGRIDSIYGWEEKDSNNYTYTKRSVLSGFIDSQVGANHGGLLLGYDFSDMMSLSLVIANDQSPTNLSRELDEPEFGARLAGNMDAMNFGLGGYFANEEWTMDLVLGMNMGQMNFDLLAVIDSDSSAGDTGFGFGLNAGFMVSEGTNFGARFEWHNMPTVNGVPVADSSLMAFTVGPQIEMEKDFVCKLDYTFSKITDGNAGHAINVGAVYGF